MGEKRNTFFSLSLPRFAAATSASKVGKQTVRPAWGDSFIHILFLVNGRPKSAKTPLLRSIRVKAIQKSGEFLSIILVRLFLSAFFPALFSLYTFFFYLSDECV